MRDTPCGERTLTELDFGRLHKLMAAVAMPQLDDVLCEAEVVPSRAIAADVVTMYARFVVRDPALPHAQTLVLCYPYNADPAKGRISVLSPAGMALIGLPVGALARWAGPGGEQRTLRIEGILFQPEANGDYLT